MYAIEHPNVKSFEFDEGPVEFAGGELYPLTRCFPMTDIDVLIPPAGGFHHVRTLIDTNGDTIADHEFVTPLVFVDLNDNGVLDREGDGLLLRPTTAKVIQDGVALTVGEEQRRAVCERIVSQLGGR